MSVTKKNIYLDYTVHKRNVVVTVRGSEYKSVYNENLAVVDYFIETYDLAKFFSKFCLYSTV